MQYELKMQQIRTQCGLTQEQLAERIGETKRVVGAWERGETAIPLEAAFNICTALGCTPNDLCGWPEGKNGGHAFNDAFEQELLESYRACTPRRQERILDTARDAAGMSKEATERASSEPKQFAC